MSGSKYLKDTGRTSTGKSTTDSGLIKDRQSQISRYLRCISVWIYTQCITLVAFLTGKIHENRLSFPVQESGKSSVKVFCCTSKMTEPHGMESRDLRDVDVEKEAMTATCPPEEKVLTEAAEMRCDGEVPAQREIAHELAATIGENDTIRDKGQRPNQTDEPEEHPEMKMSGKLEQESGQDNGNRGVKQRRVNVHQEDKEMKLEKVGIREAGRRQIKGNNHKELRTDRQNYQRRSHLVTKYGSSFPVKIFFILILISYGIFPANGQKTCLVCEGECSTELKRIYNSNNDTPFWEGSSGTLPNCKTDLKLPALCRYNSSIFLMHNEDTIWSFEGNGKHMNPSTRECPAFDSENDPRSQNNHGCKLACEIGVLALALIIWYIGLAG